LSDAYVDWLELTLAVRSAEIFNHTGLSMMCAVLDSGGRKSVRGLRFEGGGRKKERERV